MIFFIWVLFAEKQFFFYKSLDNFSSNIFADPHQGKQPVCSMSSDLLKNELLFIFF